MFISVLAGFSKGWSLLSEMTVSWSAKQSGAVPLYVYVHTPHPTTSLNCNKELERCKEHTLSHKEIQIYLNLMYSAHRKN